MVAFRNRALAALSREEWSALSPYATRLRLPHGAVLCRLGAPTRTAYFPEIGLVSLLMPSSEGETVQVAAVGVEGIVTPTVVDDPAARYEAVVALPCEVVRIDAERLRRLSERSPGLQRAFVQQMRALLVQVSHTAACLRFHTMEQRLARLLLELRDSTDRDALELTHDFLARLLGTPRSGVSMAIGSFERSGVVRSRRGRLTLLHRRALEPRACECYQARKNGVME